jgi:hypothetical protein
MVPPLLQRLVHRMMRYPKLMNQMARLKAKFLSQERWALHNMMHIFKCDEPYDGIVKMLKFNEENQHADRVKQHVLILTGEEDHFISLKMHGMQINALVNARSVSGRIFTQAEQAQNHCQVGNIGLALAVMLSWIQSSIAGPGATDTLAA